jgi:hypothetical protein
MKRRIVIPLLGFFLALNPSLLVRADAITRTAAPDFTSDQLNQPILSSDTTWAGVMVIIIGGLFVAAGTIGPIVRVNLPRRED